MINNFVIGKQVTGKSFIGRKDELKAFRDSFIENNRNVAIVGLTRFGKTSFVKNAFLDLPDNILYLNLNLNSYGSFTELLQDIIFSVEEFLDFQEIDNRVINKAVQKAYTSSNIPDLNVQVTILKRAIESIFRQLKNVGIRSIIVLDEFDNASNLFENKTDYYELFRELFSSADYDISAITISRRNLSTIQGPTYQSSTFHNIFDPYPFKGFTDHDMEDYYKEFSDQNINLSQEQKEEIEFFAGRSPFLLSILGYYIIETIKKNEPLNISKIFLEKCNQINDYYKDCLKYLQRDGNLQRVIPFITGPNTNVNGVDQMELINLGYLREKDNELISISKYFPIILLENISKYIDNYYKHPLLVLEKKLRKLLFIELNNLLDAYLINKSNIQEYEENIIKACLSIDSKKFEIYQKQNNNLRLINRVVSFFNLLTFDDISSLILDNWENIFDKYFKDYSKEEFSRIIEACSKMRNPVNLADKFYFESEEDINEILNDCEKILSQLNQDEQLVENKTTSDVNYAFISYSHENQKQVEEILENFKKSNLYFWYDKSIGIGDDFLKEIGENIIDSSILISFISKNYIESSYCKKELVMANDNDKPIIPVFLESVDLIPELEFILSATNRIYYEHYKDEKDFYKRILDSKLVQEYLVEK